MIILGLTGSIAMGKSTAKKMLARLGYPVFDADEIVHEGLYKEAGLKELVFRAFPFAKDKKGEVDRKKLGLVVFEDPDQLHHLESILHPYVAYRRKKFLRHWAAQRAKMVVLDIPLLFEKGIDQECHVTAMVSAPLFVQKQRARRRGLGEERFHQVLAQQMPDIEKRQLADFVLQTGLNKHFTLRQIRQMISQIFKTPEEDADKGKKRYAADRS